jgi:hypothetical protein
MLPRLLVAGLRRSIPYIKSSEGRHSNEYGCPVVEITDRFFPQKLGDDQNQGPAQEGSMNLNAAVRGHPEYHTVRNAELGITDIAGKFLVALFFLNELITILAQFHASRRPIRGLCLTPIGDCW